jgi:hypothetical protein
MSWTAALGCLQQPAAGRCVAGSHARSSDLADQRLLVAPVAATGSLLGASDRRALPHLHRRHPAGPCTGSAPLRRERRRMLRGPCWSREERRCARHEHGWGSSCSRQMLLCPCYPARMSAESGWQQGGDPPALLRQALQVLPTVNFMRRFAGRAAPPKRSAPAVSAGRIGPPTRRPRTPTRAKSLMRHSPGGRARNGVHRRTAAESASRALLIG